ncbi:MAG: hypothetical protein NW220_11430 [Leptolyngbyaceae cyanobacterium bins.349]|nr:hypothetical protein [Leptolyngbyaceae cyanobacterium bins.349]
MPTNLRIYKTVPSTPNLTYQQTVEARSQIISGLLVILVPLVVVGAIVSYRKHRAMVMRHRIHRLNRLWQLNSSKSSF